jgi:serine O-acetyltransferase
MIIFKTIRTIIYRILTIPHFLLLQFHKDRKVILQDIAQWQKNEGTKNSSKKALFMLLMNKKEFRNVFYYRLGKIAILLKLLLPKCNTLFITTDNIGPGFYVQHGFATIISAKSIGKNFWINQQVTIGFSNNTDCPVILDNVIVHAGAKIIGNITVGNNVIVGANAVVVKNVPDNCTVVGVPAYIIKRNGVKGKENL